MIRYSDKLLAAAMLVGLAASGQAQSTRYSEQQIAPGGFIDFGAALAVDGNRAVVGAALDPRSGTARVYEHDGDVWQETALLRPAGLAFADFFGDTVALSGDVIAVTARGDDTHGFDTGAVYLFRKSGNDWNLEQKLTTSDSVDSSGYGTALALQGNQLVVGSHSANAAGVDGAGAAYAYEFDGAQWNQIQKMTAPSAGTGQLFGLDVAMSGDWLAISSPGATQPSGRGRVALFRRFGDQWIPQQQVRAPQGSSQFDGFGLSIALDNRVLLVGAPRSGDLPDQGAAYVFQRRRNRFEYRSTLTPQDPTSRQQFGASVALDGSIALIGASRDSQEAFYAGAAYVFQRQGAGFVEKSKLFAPNPEVLDALGSEVAVSGRLLLAGAPDGGALAPGFPPPSPPSTVHAFEIPGGR